MATALTGLALAAAACSGGSAAPQVASLGSTTTVASAPASQGGASSASYAKAVSYASCMRTHGVPNMPDPNSKGQFLSVKGVLNGVDVDTGSSQYAKANKDCQHLLPNGGAPTAAGLQKALTKALQLVACMHHHGFPTMPDPSTSGDGLSLRPPAGVSLSSPQLQAAMRACGAPGT